MADFYVKRDDHQFGPYNSSRLKQHADDGRVLSSDLVRQGEDGKWYPASSVKGLFSKESVRQSADAQDTTSELDPEAEDEAMALLMQATDVPVAAPSAATAQDTSPRSTPTEAPQPADTNPNLRACPDCEKMVSKRAAACPSCGAPLEPLQSSEPSVNEQVVQQVLDQPVGEERVYFSESCFEGRVQVTASRLTLPGNIYPLSNIVSVRWGTDDRKRLYPMLQMIAGYVITAGSLLSALVLKVEYLDYGHLTSGVLVFPVIIFAFALALGLQGQSALRKAKDYCSLFVGTASGEVPQLGGTDKEFFERLVNAIDQAIIDRGGF